MSKRPRSDGQMMTQPSKVIYVKGLNQGSSEDEISDLCRPFGSVLQVMRLPDKNGAFVEFADLKEAISCIDYHALSPHTLPTGRTLQFCYSSRNSIVKKNNADNNPPNVILLVTISNVQYPVTVEVMKQVFSRVGTIDKVYIYERNNVLQAFVQMSDISQALQAKKMFDGQCIYNGCNSLKVQFSSLQSLDIRQTNERSQDFTHTVTQPIGMGVLPSPANPSLPVSNFSASQFTPAQTWGQDFNSQTPSARQSGSVLIVHELNADMITPDHLAALFSVYGNILRVKIMFNKRSTALVEMERPDMAHNAMGELNGMTLQGKVVKVEMSKGGSIPPPRANEDLTKDYTNQREYNRHRNDKPLKKYKLTDTLHISNMPDNSTDVDLMDILQQQSGAEVIETRFMDDKHHMAIVRYGCIEDALNTLVVSHNVQLSGRSLRIGFGHMQQQ